MNPGGEDKCDDRDNRRDDVKCRLVADLPDQDPCEDRPCRFADVPDRAEHPHTGPETPRGDQIGDQRIGRRSDRGNPKAKQWYDRDEPGKARHPEDQG